MNVEVELSEGDKLDTSLGKWTIDELYEERGKKKVRLYNDWRAQYEEYEVEELVEVIKEEATKVAVYKDEG